MCGPTPWKPLLAGLYSSLRPAVRVAAGVPVQPANVPHRGLGRDCVRAVNHALPGLHLAHRRFAVAAHCCSHVCAAVGVLEQPCTHGDIKWAGDGLLPLLFPKGLCDRGAGVVSPCLELCAEVYLSCSACLCLSLPPSYPILRPLIRPPPTSAPARLLCRSHSPLAPTCQRRGWRL